MIEIGVAISVGSLAISNGSVLNINVKIKPKKQEI